MAGIFENESTAFRPGVNPSEEQLWREWAHSMLYPTAAPEVESGVINRPSDELRRLLDREFRRSYENHLSILRRQLEESKREIERLRELVAPAELAIESLRRISQDLAGCEELPQERLVSLRDQAKSTYEANAAVGFATYEQEPCMEQDPYMVPPFPLNQKF